MEHEVNYEWFQTLENLPETMTTHHLEMSGSLNALLINLLSSSNEDFQVGDGAIDRLFFLFNAPQALLIGRYIVKTTTAATDSEQAQKVTI